MSTHYDEKGKFFTEIISKKSIPVRIQTKDNRIDGIMHIRRGERFKDELNHSEQFLAITDAVISDNNNAELYQTDFLAVNRNNIVWIFPLNGEDESSGDQT
ncbi:MAG: hypothetical protein PVF83_17770 [Anaerolineales bacterium]|jgi:hypothetical protein